MPDNELSHIDKRTVLWNIDDFALQVTRCNKIVSLIDEFALLDIKTHKIVSQLLAECLSGGSEFIVEELEKLTAEFAKNIWIRPDLAGPH